MKNTRFFTQRDAMPTTGPPAPTVPWRNWAGNQRSSAAVARPSTPDELVAVVQRAAAEGRRIKPVGHGHSFSAIACTDDLRVEQDRLAGLVSVDRAERLVTVQAGMRLRNLVEILAAHGLALLNLGDINEQTIAGAIATGTHGTGAGFGCLSTFVEALTLVAGTGEVIRCSATEHPDVFAAARVGLGALGVITEVTLRCVDAFVLHADERPMPLPDMLADLATMIETNDHFEVYWFPYTEWVQVKRNNRAPADDRPLSRWRAWLDDDFLSNTVFGGLCRLGRRLPAAVPAISAVSARGLRARQYTGRPDKVLCTPRRVRFVEMEYGIPRAALPLAFAGLRRLVPTLPLKVLFPVEIRFTAADDIWLSHGYDRDSAYIAVHQYVGAEYEAYFRAFEQVVTPLGGRPHWGKLHYRDAESLRSAYPRFDDFLAVRDRLDPDRVFANPYLDRVLGR
jgi:FAD-linked oxidoreductase